MGPRVHRFRGGWAVSSDGFATFASTRDEALRQFHLHATDTDLTAERMDSLLEGVNLAFAEDRHVDLVGLPDEVEASGD